MASTVTDLNNFDLLSVCGEEAIRFLQGQLSCNLDKLSPEHSLTGAYCDLKGRVITDMQVLLMRDCVYLLCLSGMGNTLRRTLDKYIVFSKAKTEMVTLDFERYGIHGEGAEQTVTALFGKAPANAGDVVQHDGGLVFRLPDPAPRYEVLVQTECDELLDRIQALGATDDTEEWELADLRQGIVHIHPDIQETYTPQLLNYDINGVIDFKKGCYTGQEIVARMHYRATAKKRLYLGRVGEMRVSLQTLVMHKDEVVGEMLGVSRTDTGDHEFLAILPCELVDAGAKLLLRNGSVESGARNSPAVTIQLLPIPGLNT